MLHPGQQSRLSSQTGAAPTLERSPFIDGWRGVFLVLMFLDHLPLLVPGMFGIFGYLFEIAGYVSVFEGFVFLSGFCTVLSYTHNRRFYGSAAVWKRSIVRSAVIYLTYVTAILLFIMVSKYGQQARFDWKSWTDLLKLSPGLQLVRITTLVDQPRFFDVLPMYISFLLIAPLIIREFEQNRYWLVFTISIAVWIAAQWGLRPVLNPWWPNALPFGTGYFNLFGWQLLFVIGMGCGYWRFKAGAEGFSGLRRIMPVAYVLALLFFCVEHAFIRIAVPGNLIGMSRLGVLRIVNFLCLAILAHSAQRPLQAILTWRGFRFLGKQSLQVFAFHTFPIYAFAILISGSPTASIVGQVLAGVSLVGCLFLIAWITLPLKSVVKHSGRNSQLGCQSTLNEPA